MEMEVVGLAGLQKHGIASDIQKKKKKHSKK